MNTIINRAADNIRILAAAMVEKQNPAIPEEPWGEQITSMYYFLNS